MISESGIIHVLQSVFPQYIGDDAAVLSIDHPQTWVITQDALVEDVHFRISYQSPETLAHKALHVNLSDIAAMGATPRYVLLTLSTPAAYTIYIEKFIKAFTKACKAADVMLIGGDTTRAAQCYINVTAIGTTPFASSIRYRHTAKVGDYICVAGYLGHAHLGFYTLEQAYPGYEDFKHAFLAPDAKRQEGLFLGQHSAVTAMMDVSDGLWTDLPKLAEASGVQARIHLDRIQHHADFLQACHALGLNPTEIAWGGGEDYALLFTVASSQYAEFKKAFETQFHTPLQCLGELCFGKGVQWLQDQQVVTHIPTHFQHF